ncbi:hypothetical protein BH18ACI1_BH18ACI1_23730 [soil metagenome]
MTVIEKELISKIRVLSPNAQKIALEFVEKLEAEQTKPKRLRVLEKIDEIVSSKPKEIWAEVPTDSAEKVDEYLYGAKK